MPVKQELIQYVPAIIPITFDFSSWNKAFSDLEEVKIVFKKTIEDADDLFLSKTYTAADDDLTIEEASNKFLLTINQDDYEKLKPSTYFLRMGLKFTGETQFRDAGSLFNNEIDVIKSWLNKI